MNRHHNGSGRRTVIPADWAERHRPVAEAMMVGATVALSDPTAAPTSAGWNDANQQVSTVPAAAYWTGAARIQILNQQGRQPIAAEDPETVAGYLVVIPAAVSTVGDGHRAAVVTCDDAALVGKTLRVVTVARGSLLWERDLFCELTD